MPDAIGADVVGVLQQHADQLQAGAIITIDEMTSRWTISRYRAGTDGLGDPEDVALAEIS
jgi:hypothetical protein